MSAPLELTEEDKRALDVAAGKHYDELADFARDPRHTRESEDAVRKHMEQLLTAWGKIEKDLEGD